MIGNAPTNEKGNPVEAFNPLSKDNYNPNDEVKKLWSQVLGDVQNAYNLQQKPFDEFDQMSLLQRMNLDQQTFAAFVGANFEPADRSWRWKGRKNTARNKIIGILAHVISGMLFPMVYAYNEENKEDHQSAYPGGNAVPFGRGCGAGLDPFLGQQRGNPYVRAKCKHVHGCQQRAQKKFLAKEKNDHAFEHAKHPQID